MDSYSPVDPERTVLDDTPKGLLVVQSGPASGQQIPLRDEVYVGRDRSNTMVFLDKKVSRYHAKLIPIDETYVITDLGSSNGTYVNGVRIAQPVRLHSGDSIRLGESELRFYQGESPPQILPTPRAGKKPASSLAQFMPAAHILDSSWLASASRSTWFWYGCGAAFLASLAILVALVLGLFIGQTLN